MSSISRQAIAGMIIPVLMAPGHTDARSLECYRLKPDS